eukprot:TRINITY_DN9396_c0_g1_i2.p1 TRINITY_DN9396_c0_g1~~TRINITY_DN9396_c0_g1_i2.p1  ORF type:complete len:658 (-),score=145.55 TRINITY_DN9396_c0_g1_i2:19-1992(-)
MMEVLDPYLSIACSLSNWDKVESILKVWSSNIINQEGAMKEGQEYQQHLQLLSQPDALGFHPLHWAVMKANHKIVEKLVQIGADINSVNHSGQTPLHLALENADISCARILLDAANPIDLNIKDEIGITCSHLISSNPVLNELLMDIFERNIPVDLSAQDYRGWTCLHMAVFRNNREFLEMALSLFNLPQSIVNQGNLDANTPLHIAINYQKNDIALYLMDYLRADMNIYNVFGDAPIHIAIKISDKDMISHLIRRGANIEFTNADGLTLEELGTAKIQEVVRNHLWRVNESGYASKDTTFISGLESPSIGKESQFVVTTKNDEGNNLNTGRDTLEVHVSNGIHSASNIEIVDELNGKYTVKYIVNQPGEYEIAVLLFGQHINDSPFSVETTDEVPDAELPAAEKDEPVPESIETNEDKVIENPKVKDVSENEKKKRSKTLSPRKLKKSSIGRKRGKSIKTPKGDNNNGTSKRKKRGLSLRGLTRHNSKSNEDDNEALQSTLTKLDILTKSQAALEKRVSELKREKSELTEENERLTNALMKVQRKQTAVNSAATEKEIYIQNLEEELKESNSLVKNLERAFEKTKSKYGQLANDNSNLRFTMNTNEQSQKCCGCFENDKDTVLLPCSHFSYCYECAKQIKVCHCEMEVCGYIIINE